MADMYSAPECAFVVDGNHIQTDGTVAKKVTGTSMGGILGVSPWSSPFQVACNLLGLGRKDVSMKKAVQRGIALEASIIRYADQTWGGPEGMTYYSADEVFAKRDGDHDAWESDFEDEVFAGHVDGVVKPENEDTFYILEIKTTINPDSWAEGVPEYYFWQVAIYNEFLAEEDKVYFVLGLANDNTDRDPASWVANENTCLRFIQPVDREAVRAKMDEIREWYDSYIRKGVTPDYDPSNPGDVELYNRLVALSASEDDQEAQLDKIVALQNAIDAARAKAGLDKLESDLKELKESLKESLVGSQTNRLSPGKGWTASISTRTTTAWDVGRMVADGIDPAKYRRESTSYALLIKAESQKQDKE